EDADKSAEHEVETALRLLRLELRDRRLVSGDELQFGDEVSHKPCIWLQRLQKCAAPDRQLGVALAEKRPHQALKSLHEGRVRYVALVLIELAGGEQPPRWHERLVQFVDDRGFADAGIAGDQHQLRRAALDNAVEGGEQGLDLALSAIQLLGDQQPVGRVVSAKREDIDAAVSLPIGEAALEVA